MGLKIYRVNCQVAVAIIFAYFGNKEHFGKTLDKHLHANKKLGARDRHFIADSVYKAVRYYRYYLHLCDLSAVEKEAEAWQILAAILLSEQCDIPDWFMVDAITLHKISERIQQPVSHKIKAAYTDWFYAAGEKQYGEQWTNIADALNLQAEVCIRANTLVMPVETLKADFAKAEIATREVEDAPFALVLEGRTKLTNHPLYLNGCFEFQDISSQMVVDFLDVKSGQRVVDACAGAGGKSLYLAQLMQNQGQIIALDIHSRKLEALQKRAKKAKATIIKTVVVETDFFNQYESAFDKVLIDAPCSGSGVIKRNPENKWQLTAENLAAITERQRHILAQNALVVAVGGELVYATCSILAQENEEIVAAFLAQNSAFELVAQKSLVPSVNTDFDGFFMAKMQRKG